MQERLKQTTDSRGRGQAKRAAVATLAILVLLAAAWSAWQWRASQVATAPGPAEPVEKAWAPQEALLRDSLLPAEVETEGEQSAPAPALDLALLGVMVSDNPTHSRAIIAAARGPGQTYAIGQTVADTAARLHSVASDHAMLAFDGGRRERLELAAGGGEEPPSPPDDLTDPLEEILREARKDDDGSERRFGRSVARGGMMRMLDPQYR